LARSTTARAIGYAGHLRAPYLDNEENDDAYAEVSAHDEMEEGALYDRTDVDGVDNP